MLLLTKEQLQLHQDSKNYYICGKGIFKKLSKSQIYQKVFHIGSNHDYHFITKELVNNFEGKFECLGENTEKQKKFSLPIVKEITKIYKDGNESFLNLTK